jgi:DNA-directed RNA polymerase specialized sigma24 family protein
VSPQTVRRFRAERLLRKEFEGLRGRVLAAVRARLRAGGVTLDGSDLEGCYSAAWQGLYMRMLEGEEIENPTAWLVLVTFRRAIEEHRARGRVQRLSERMQGGAPPSWRRQQHPAHERDLAGELDDRTRLRQLFEGLRGRLSTREREAAALCYLQGLTRAQAAARMGVSEARMRKLMEGAGPGRPGVSGKVGALVEAIRDGAWCEQQGSLMRAFAFSVLDPDGERYQLAVAHCEDCPACRAYVLSLRGLAATLPPTLLPLGLGAAALAREGARAGVAGAGASGAGGTGALSASGAAGVGAGAGASGAGGGWLLAGGAKLAAGCVLALSVGAGCVALSVGPSHPHRAAHVHRAPHALSARVAPRSSALAAAPVQVVVSAPRGTHAGRARAQAAALTPSARASREFGPEQELAVASHAGSQPVTAHAASADSTPETEPASVSAASPSAGQSSAPSGATSAAEREFSPG